MSTETILAAIHAERVRQVKEEGFTAEHDDEHVNDEMPRAAAVYCMLPEEIYTDEGVKIYTDEGEYREAYIRPVWQWSEEWKKPSSRKHNLIRAAALIVAELERLERLDD